MIFEQELRKKKVVNILISCQHYANEKWQVEACKIIECGEEKVF